MDIPQELTPALARLLADPSDTQAMRVIVRRVANQCNYLLRGKRRSYQLEYNPVMCCHFIDIPYSLWMHGVSTAQPYEDNQSVAHDIQSNFAHMESLVILPVPWGDHTEIVAPAVAVSAPDNAPLISLKSLAERLGAPPTMIDAIDLVLAGGNAKSICLSLDNTEVEAANQPDQPELPPIPIATKPPTGPLTNAERMRKMREAKAAKKLAERNLQPA